MTFSAPLTVVRDFKTHAIGISKKRCPIVRGVLRVVLCLGSFDARCAKLNGHGYDVGHRIDAKAEVMQSGRIGIVRG